MLFWLGLVAGLIIGWVVEWIIDWRFWRRDLFVGLEREKLLRRELADARREISRLQAQLADATWPAKEAIAAVVVRDPLEQIEGVGPLFAQRLHEAGIFTFDQLANTTPDAVQRALQLDDRRNVDAQAWIAQAKDLAHPANVESPDQSHPSQSHLNQSHPNHE